MPREYFQDSRVELLPDTIKYNIAMHCSSTRVVGRFCDQASGAFNRQLFAERLSRHATFPYVSVGDLIKIATSAGARLSAKVIGLQELINLKIRALIYIRSPSGLRRDDMLAELKIDEDGKISISDERNSPASMKVSDLDRVYTGIAIMHDPCLGSATTTKSAKIHVSIISGPLSTAIYHECNMLNQWPILYQEEGRRPDMLSVIPQERCESQGYISVGASSVVDHMVEAIDRKTQLSRKAIRGVLFRKLEQNACLRAGYDNGVNLMRGKVLHLVVGGEGVSFSVRMIHDGQPFSLRSGDALQIKSCDHLFRTAWGSEWEGSCEGTSMYLLTMWESPY